MCLHIYDFSMYMKLEQTANIKFCMKLSKSGAETFEIVRVYGNEAMSCARCFEWDVRFKRGRTSLEDNERSGRPSTSSTPKNVETIRQIVHEDHRRTIKDIAAIIDMSYGTVQTILTCDLNMHCVAAKFVPRLLTPEQKEHRVAIYQELCQRALDDPSSCRGSSLGTRVGSTGMILTLNNSLRNGKAQDPKAQRRRDRTAARPRACSCFLTFKGLCTMNLPRRPDREC
jgi:hypothetical protein